MRGSESLKYCFFVSIIFSFCGFAYSLVVTLNSEIPIDFNPSLTKTIAIGTANFGGRVVGPVLGYGFCGTSGLKPPSSQAWASTALGRLCSGPLAIYDPTPGFLISNFVVGFGFALEMMAAFGFLTLCGPLHYAEVRTCLGTGLWTAASVIGTVLGQKALFTSTSHSQSLIAVQWTYLGSAISTTIFALCFYYLPAARGLGCRAGGASRRARDKPS